jgi:hypothetical protein
MKNGRASFSVAQDNMYTGAISMHTDIAKINLDKNCILAEPVQIVASTVLILDVPVLYWSSL